MFGMRTALVGLLALCGAALFAQTKGPSRGRVSENMVLVDVGSFQMGSPASEAGRYDDEGPQHRVTVKSFSIGKYEVTQKEWVELMRSNPSNFKGDTLPIENVSWYEAVEYCNKLSVKEGLTPAYTRNGDRVTWNRNANGYRLPTEAEWEYAAKGGNKGGSSYEYPGGNSPDRLAWYGDNSGGSTHPVGTKQPNGVGVYDMSGNVWEWCWDWYGSYSGGVQTDPMGPSSGSNRIARGGSWGSGIRALRSAFRSYSAPSFRASNLGFRLVRP
ncbi:MAG: formylglycine-generating enzyme family protein [Treponema sp.]|jgi:formylglycine-generating enzyme required for sulfatase activity|nr:formylglycine-generating enzyme family protein [Treponema sp.]